MANAGARCFPLASGLFSLQLMSRPKLCWGWSASGPKATSRGNWSFAWMVIYRRG